MQKFTKTTTALLVTGASAAFAAGTHTTGLNEAHAYLKFGFDNKLQRASDTQYGFALHMDQQYSPIQTGAPTAQMLFDRRGFLGAWLNGLPVAKTVMLKQNEGGDGGTRFTVIDWSLMAVGATGIGYALSELIDQSDSPDSRAGGGGGGTTPASCPAGTTGSPPACIPTSLPSCPAGQTGTPPACIPSVAPSCPTGQTGTPPACIPTSAPSCPAGQVGTPPACLPGVGLAGSNSFQMLDDSILRESTSWLDEGTGQMGDLYFVKK